MRGGIGRRFYINILVFASLFVFVYGNYSNSQNSPILFAHTNPFFYVTFLALDLAAPQKFAVTFFVTMLLRHIIASATAHG